MHESEIIERLERLKANVQETRTEVNTMLQGITNELVKCQADVQSALGVLRLASQGRKLGVFRDDYEAVENWLARSLARQHDLLRSLGHEMASTATHPDVKPWTG